MARAKKQSEQTVTKINLGDFQKAILSENFNGQVAPLVNYHISISDQIKFIDSVYLGCFEDDEYSPHTRDFLYKINILRYFCDVKYENNMVREFFDFCYSEKTSWVFWSIRECINSDQLKHIDQSIDELISFNKQRIIARTSSISDDVVGKLNGIFDGVGSLIGSVISIVQDFDIGSVEKLLSKLGDEVGPMETVENIALDIVKNRNNPPVQEKKGNVLPFDPNHKEKKPRTPKTPKE